MKKLLRLETGEIHDVVDTTDWGDGFIEVETFKYKGYEWIKNTGTMFIPEGWCIDVLTSLGFIDSCEEASADWCWECATDGEVEEKIAGFRVLHTGLFELEGCAKAIKQEDEPVETVQLEVTGNGYFFQPGEPSPEEKAFAEKQAALKAQETDQPKAIFPSPAVKEINCFPNMLGGDHGGKHEED